MMILTEKQHDALVTAISSAFGRAAESLSELTGRRVTLEVPKVSVLPIGEISADLGRLIDSEIATVHQIFTGSVAGDAMLLLNTEGAVNLVRLLAEDRVPSTHLIASDREVLTEVGNILLNACLGTFGDLLQVHITFSVPRLHMESLDALLESITIGSEELRYALVVYSNFHIRDQEVGGYLVVVLGVASLDKLVHAVESLS
jgi:chemotaxis protein CheC